MIDHTTSLNTTEQSAFRYIRNRLLRGEGSPSVREVMRHIKKSSPRSADLIINKLIAKDLLQRKDSGQLQLVKDVFASQEHASTVSLPIVGTVAAGSPILAEQNIDAYVSVDERLLAKAKGAKCFLLRVSGDSMDKRGIMNGDLAIVRQQQIANAGDNIVALIDDSATIKELTFAEDKVVLKPHSTNASIRPIILQEDFLIQGIVIGTLPDPT
ncbi:repressor LexA [Candidatus Saccharibacteria bacterium]|nr:repressor LexA [Candidatus Saccharibacteria bacterium]